MTKEADAVKLKSQLSSLQLYFIKLISTMSAILVLVLATVSIVKSAVETSAVLRGGPAFWGAVENGLYKFAEQKDLPEEKRAKIIAALRKISKKYGPFLDALAAREAAASNVPASRE